MAKNTDQSHHSLTIDLLSHHRDWAYTSRLHLVYNEASSDTLRTEQLRRCVSRRRQTHLHKGIVVDLNPTRTVGVVALERLGERLDHHARAHKAIKRDARCTSSCWSCRRHATWCARVRSYWTMPNGQYNQEHVSQKDSNPQPPLSGSYSILTVLLRYDVKQLGRETVSERLECVGEFALVDRTRSVLVKVAEDALPVLDVFPKSANSLKLIWPLRSTSKTLISILTVSKSNGVQSPLTSAWLSSCALICPLRSRSTAMNHCHS